MKGTSWRKSAARLRKTNEELKKQNSRYAVDLRDHACLKLEVKRLQGALQDITSSQNQQELLQQQPEQPPSAPTSLGDIQEHVQHEVVAAISMQGMMHVDEGNDCKMQMDEDEDLAKAIAASLEDQDKKRDPMVTINALALDGKDVVKPKGAMPKFQNGWRSFPPNGLTSNSVSVRCGSIPTVPPLAKAAGSRHPHAGQSSGSSVAPKPPPMAQAKINPTAKAEGYTFSKNA